MNLKKIIYLSFINLYVPKWVIIKALLILKHPSLSELTPYQIGVTSPKREGLHKMSSLKKCFELILTTNFVKLRNQ